MPGKVYVAFKAIIWDDGIWRFLLQIKLQRRATLGRSKPFYNLMLCFWKVHRINHFFITKLLNESVHHNNALRQCAMAKEDCKGGFFLIGLLLIFSKAHRVGLLFLDNIEISYWARWQWPSDIWCLMHPPRWWLIFSSNCVVENLQKVTFHHIQARANDVDQQFTFCTILPSCTQYVSNLDDLDLS